MANVSSSNGLEKYPKLRFKGFSEPWTQVLLSNVFKKSTKKNSDGSITNVICNSAKNGLIPQREYFDKNIANSENTDGYYIIEQGDFVYNPRKSSDAPYGPVSIYKYSESGIVSPLYLCFRALNTINSSFYDYFFKSPSWHRYIYLSGDSGARHDRVSIKDDVFFAMPVNIPSEEEQNRIASFLTLIEERIAHQQALVEHLKKYKRGVIEQVITELTMACDSRRISSFAKCVAGATPDTKKHEYWDNGTIPWLSSGEVNKKRITSTDKFITPLGYQKTSTKMLPIKTVIIALAGQGKTRGTVAITEKEVCTNQSLAGIITDNTVDSEYLFYYLETQYDNLRILSSGDGTRGGLNLQLINDYLVPTPSLTKQKFIAEFGTLIDKNISANENLLNQLQVLKSAMLQKLFV